jgi:RNA polymerase sigma-70 factor (sigma-E family)
MKLNDLGGAAALPRPGRVLAVVDSDDAAAAAVGSLYQETAVRLIRLAYVILSDRQAAEDVVQEAFCNLYRQWSRLDDPERARHYVRASVINGCRTVMRRQRVRTSRVLYELPAAAADASVLASEERDNLIRSVDRLPDRQREALVLRFYLDLPDEDIARLMSIRPSTVRSSIHRALDTLGRDLEEGS